MTDGRAASSRPLCPHRERPKAPSGSAGRGLSAGWFPTGCGDEPALRVWLAVSTREQAGRSERGGSRRCRNLSQPICGLRPFTRSAASLEIRREGSHSFNAVSAECRVLARQAHFGQIRGGGYVSRILNAPTDPCQISLRPTARTRAHPRPRQWLWLAGDGCASCPLLQRRTETFFPDCAALVSSRDKKAPVRRPPLRSGPPPIRLAEWDPECVQRCKPLPQTSHRGRE